MDDVTLESRLAVLRNAAAGRLPHLTALNERLFAELAEDVAPGAANIGDPAPDFQLRNALNDAPVRLSWVLDMGPAVVAFYRGCWCPYSNVQVHALQQAYDEIRSLGAELLLIGPETRENALKMRDKWQATVPILYDAGGAAMDAFRIAYDVPDYLRDEYARIGFPELNPGTGWRLPITATYVVDQLSVIRARHLDPDYTRRMEPAEIVAALQRLRRSVAA